MIPDPNHTDTNHKAPNTPEKRALRLWLRMFSCTNMIEQEISRQLRDHYGVTLAQFDVLSELEHARQPVTMTQLSEQLMVTKGNVSGLIGRLERDALVMKTPSVHDGRVSYLTLSTKGATLFHAMAKEHEQWLTAMFKELRVDDQNDMITLLKNTKDSVSHYRESV